MVWFTIKIIKFQEILEFFYIFEAIKFYIRKHFEIKDWYYEKSTYFTIQGLAFFCFEAFLKINNKNLNILIKGSLQSNDQPGLSKNLENQNNPTLIQ